jgi:hypothetical protein
MDSSSVRPILTNNFRLLDHGVKRLGLLVSIGLLGLAVRRRWLRS